MESAVARAVQILLALGGAYLAGLWVVLIVWTYRDIEARSRNVVTQVGATVLSALFFIPGVLLYILLRPKETLDSSFQRSLEEEYLLQDLEASNTCPSCERPVDDDFILCPHCETRLKEPCPNCGRSIDVGWSICPYCGNDEALAASAIRPAIAPILRFTEEPASEDDRLLGGRVTVRPVEIERERHEESPDVSPGRRIAAITETALPIRLFDRRRTRESSRPSGVITAVSSDGVDAVESSEVGSTAGDDEHRSNG